MAIRVRSCLLCLFAAGVSLAILAGGLLPAATEVKPPARPSAPPPAAPKARPGPQPAGALPKALPVCPLLRGVYDGSARRVLGGCGALTLNEEDLLLYLLLTEDDRPVIYNEFLNDANPQKRALDETRLKKKITEWFYCQTVAARHGQTPSEFSEFERLLLRVMKAPVAEFVWIQNVIRPRIVISLGDERHYYRNHPEQFVTARRADTRHIFRRLDPSYTGQQIRDERQLMDTLRKMLLDNPDLFEKVASQYSQDDNAAAGGLAPPVTEGGFTEEYEKASFALTRPGEISEVVESPGGLYLIQLVKKETPAPIPFDQARELLKPAILVDQTRVRYKYEISRLQSEARVESLLNIWNSLLDSSCLVRIGDFQLTKGDFWRLYPAIIDDSGALVGAEANQRAQRLIESQLIWQDLKDRKLADDPRIRRAEQLATAILLTRKAEEQYLEEHLQLSRDEARPQVEQQLAFKPAPPRKRLFRLWGEVDQPRRHDATTLANLREYLPRALQNYIDQAQRDPQAILPAEKLNEAPMAVRGIKNFKAPPYKFSWADMGYVDLETVPMLRGLLSPVGAGCFSPVESSGETAVAYFVAAEKRVPPSEREDFEARAYRALVSGQTNSILDVFRGAISQTLHVAYRY